MSFTHRIHYRRPNFADKEPYLFTWIFIETEEPTILCKSTMYIQHSQNALEPQWERGSSIEGDFSKRIIEEYLTLDMFLEAWDKLRNQ